MLNTNYLRLRTLIKENLTSIIYIFVLSLLMLIPAAVSPIFKKVFADHILPGTEAQWLPTLIVLMVFMAFFSMMITLMKNICLIKIANRIESMAESRYFYRLFHSPVSLFSKGQRTQLLQKANAAKGISNILTVNVVTTLFALINFVFYLVFMFRANVFMTAIVVVLVVLTYFFKKLQVTWLKRLTQKGAIDTVVDSLSDLNAQDEITSSIGLQSIDLLKSTSSENRFFKRLMSIKIDKVLASRQNDYNAAAAPLNNLGSILFLNLLLLVAAIDIMNQDFTIGAYLAFQAYAVAFFAPLNQVMGLRIQLNGFEKNLENYEENLKGKPIKVEVFEDTVPAKLRGCIEVRNVTFGYQKETPVLKNINITIAPGERVAVVGKSGEGKTTLIRLLQGLYQPQEGEILYDGIPIDKVDPTVRALSIGSANQEISIFSASIADNITLFNESIDDEQIIQAAMDARFHEYVVAQKGGYQAMLTQDGRNMSGGQRQRLELTRALLYKPTIVLIDEGLGAIDVATTKNIYDNLLARSLTMVSITHTVSSVRFFDRIYVLENGSVACEGSHQEVMRKNTYYRNLFSKEGWSL